jgi:hypothetical protein
VFQLSVTRHRGSCKGQGRAGGGRGGGGGANVAGLCVVTCGKMGGGRRECHIRRFTSCKGSSYSTASRLAAAFRQLGRTCSTSQADVSRIIWDDSYHSATLHVPATAPLGHVPNELCVCCWLAPVWCALRCARQHPNATCGCPGGTLARGTCATQAHAG